jgi:sulfoacetaldehyde acetyltransferase
MNTMTEAKNLVTSPKTAGGKVRMTPSEAFIETLVAHKVKDVFGIVGSAYMDALDLFPGAGIRLYSVAHEQNAAHMADGYGRVTNRPTVCIAQNGPGITNFVTAVAAAYWAHTPMVVVTPESGSLTAGHGGFQETEQMPIFSKITKWQVHVNSPLRMAELMHRAFTVALHERGPVQVNIPRDYFYGEGDYEILPPLVIERAAGGSNSLDKAARMLGEAKYPVIVSGGGIVMADGVEEVKALAEHLTAPVVNSYLHNDSFPSHHPLSCGPLGYQGSKAAMRTIARADVVLALGTRLGPFGTLPQHGIDYWPKDAKIIQIDADHRMLGLVKKVSLAIQGDARLAAAELLKRLKARGARKPDKTRLVEVQRERESWIAELANWHSPNKKGQIGPRRALAQLAKAMPRNAMVSTDIGNVCSVANSYLRFEQPLSFLAAMSWGNCGYAYPTALGAKVARPDRPAIAYVGDGAWGMSLAEVMTAVKEKIPAVAVVFNNGQWGAEKKNQIDYFENRFVGTNLANPDFSEVARVMGAEGYRVEHEDEVSDALKAALKSGKPSVVEIMLTQELGEPFRRDAFRKPRRLLPKYRRFNAKEYR